MDVNDLLTALNGVLNLGDTLDSNGIGISAMTNGQHTTRELCQMELGTFLLYIGAGGGFFNDGQAGLVNLLLSDKYGQIPSWQMKSVADELDMPIAANNATFTAFKNGDDALSQQNGVPTKQLTDLLISLYESFGGLMVAFNENVVSRVRCDTYVNGLKARQGSSTISTSSTSPSTKPSAAKSTTSKSTIGANVDISSYIPAGVTLTDNQKEYLSAIVELINKYGPVDSSTVAMHMHKSTSAVSSAVSTLMKKGILDKNDDAKIVIADKKESSTKNVEGSTSKTNSAKKTTKTAVTKLPVGCLNAKQYKGIHQVKGQEEIICPDGSWLIPVQPGCSYSMDPDHTKMSMMGKYPLQIQSTQDCDFDNPYDSRFNFVLFAFGPRIQAFSTITDLSSNEAKEKITKLAWGADADYRFFKQTDSIAIMTKEVNANQSEYSVLFLLFIRGTQFVSHGQIVIRGKALKTAKDEMATVLNSIIVNGPPEGDEGYKPVVLPQKFALTYRKHETLMLDGIINLPVPDGFKGSTNSSLVGSPRKFSIIPSNYSDYTAAMDASIGMSCVPLMGSLPSFSEAVSKGVCDLALVKMCEMLESQGMMPAQVPQHVAQMTTKGIITFQKTFGEDTYKYQIAKAILWVDKSAYLLSFALNFDEKIADRNDVSMDSLMIFFDWLNRIQLPGEKTYSSSIEKEAASSDNTSQKEAATSSKTDSKKTTGKSKSTSASKETSVYSSAYQKAMKARLLPGEKELPPEIYCKEIDFRAGDIAENGIKFNLLKDNGPVIEEHKYMTGKIKGAYLEIPEGVIEIGNYAFSHSEFQIVKLPRSLRILKQGVFSDCKNLRKVILQEGVKELKAVICGECPNVTELHLPSTVEIIDDDAFKWETLSRRSDITVYMTGASAKKVYANAKREELDLPGAKSFIIDGKSYTDLEDYVRASERERQAAAERQRQEMLKRDEEARKNTQRNSLRQRISQLEKERDTLKGLFAGVKRNKIQREIDELNALLRRI